ncbi:MAG: hypothetical protein WCF18_22170 [Chthoniobacteraceae bacterium]
METWSGPESRGGNVANGRKTNQHFCRDSRSGGALIPNAMSDCGLSFGFWIQAGCHGESGDFFRVRGFAMPTLSRIGVITFSCCKAAIPDGVGKAIEPSVFPAALKGPARAPSFQIQPN